MGTNISALSEAVVHGETGLLVPPNSPDQLADAIEKLWNDPAMRRRMGEKMLAPAREINSASSKTSTLSPPSFGKIIAMPEKIKIFYLIERMARAGTELSLLQLLQRIDRSRFEPVLCCLNDTMTDRSLGPPRHPLPHIQRLMESRRSTHAAALPLPL